jgi:hypothetical protein
VCHKLLASKDYWNVKTTEKKANSLPHDLWWVAASELSHLGHVASVMFTCTETGCVTFYSDFKPSVIRRNGAPISLILLIMHCRFVVINISGPFWAISLSTLKHL